MASSGYQQAYSEIEQQKRQVAEARQQLQQHLSVPQQIQQREAMMRVPRYRQEVRQQEAAKQETLKSISESDVSLEEQLKAIKKYEKEGYTIKKTDKGFEFSKKIRGTRTVTSSPLPKDERYNTLNKEISSLTDSINRIKWKMATTPSGSPLQKGYEMLLKSLTNARSKKITERNKYTQTGARGSVSYYTTIQKLLSHPAFKKIESTPSGKTFIEHFKKVKEPTTETRLVAAGVTPSYYEKTGKVTFPEYTSKLSGVTYPETTFTSKEQPYSAIVGFVKEREKSDIHSYLQNKPAEEFIKEGDEISYVTNWADPSKIEPLKRLLKDYQLEQVSGERVYPEDFVGPKITTQQLFEKAFEDAYKSMSEKKQREYNIKFIDWENIPLNERKSYLGFQQIREGWSEDKTRKEILSYLKSHPGEKIAVPISPDVVPGASRRLWSALGMSPSGSMSYSDIQKYKKDPDVIGSALTTGASIMLGISPQQITYKDAENVLIESAKKQLLYNEEEQQKLREEAYEKLPFITREISSPLTKSFLQATSQVLTFPEFMVEEVGGRIVTGKPVDIIPLREPLTEGLRTFDIGQPPGSLEHVFLKTGEFVGDKTGLYDTDELRKQIAEQNIRIGKHPIGYLSSSIGEWAGFYLGGKMYGSAMSKVKPPVYSSLSKYAWKPSVAYIAKPTVDIFGKAGKRIYSGIGQVAKPPQVVSKIVGMSGLKQLGKNITLWKAGEYIPPSIRATMRGGWTQLKGRLRGQEFVPQQEEFMLESITGEKQYPVASSPEEYIQLWSSGGSHGTTGMQKLYSLKEKLDTTLYDVMGRTKTGKLSTVFKGPVDDAVLDFAKKKQLIFSGSGAMKLQSKFSLEKLRRFFGKEVDKDFLVRGDYNITYRTTKEFADELTRKTGKKYTVDVAKHEGTWTIRDPSGKRIIDVTSTLSPQGGILGPEASRQALVTRIVDGLPVADMKWLLYNKIEISQLRGLKEFEQINKAITDIKIMTGKKYPELLVAPLPEQVGESIMFTRGATQQFSEKLRSFSGLPPRKMIVGYGKRITELNPAQYQIFHQYPRGKMGRWMLGLEKRSVYEASLFKSGFKGKPRVFIEPSPGMLPEKDIQKLIVAAKEGPEEFIMVEKTIQSGRQAAGLPVLRSPTYKAIQRLYIKGLSAEAEAGHIAGNIGFKIGWTPEMDTFMTYKPKPSTFLGKTGKRYGDWWAKRLGYKQFTVDIPTGRKIPLYPVEAKYATDLFGASPRMKLSLRPLTSEESAMQSLIPKMRANEVMDNIGQFGKGVQERIRRAFPDINFSGSKILSKSEMDDIISYMRNYVNVKYVPAFTPYHIPHLYQSYRRYAPKERQQPYYYPREYVAKRIVGRQQPYVRYNEYTKPIQQYSYPYEDRYSPSYTREVYTPRYYTPEYTSPRQPKTDLLAPLPILSEETKKITSRKGIDIGKGYKERKWDVPLFSLGKKPKFFNIVKP